MVSWYVDPDFRTIELDRESRIPDELHGSSVERDDPQDESLPSCSSSENGARNASTPSSRSTEDLDRRRSAQSYFNAGLPWTGEFEDLVNEGLVDVS